jgi:restriction system protein
MALWLTRAGGHGEFEQKFLDESRVYLTWDTFDVDLAKVPDVQALRQRLSSYFPSFSPKKIINHASQIWPFFADMKIGDWIVLPSKLKATIHVAEIVGDYTHSPSGPDPFFHFRKVKWLAKDVPREHFSQDLLYSFGAFMTICEIKRNDAEARVRTMAASGWQAESSRSIVARISGSDTEVPEASQADVNLEELARDSIAKWIVAKFKGHGLARLVDAILKARGYTTHLSQAGADKGVDILAAPEPLGFGQPRLCVQVKSEQTAIDRPTLDQLIGTMQNFHAEQGLLVSWGGFKPTVLRELPAQFFRVRLWDQQTLIDELVMNYDKIDADIRAEIPLKRIWTIATEELEE